MFACHAGFRALVLPVSQRPLALPSSDHKRPGNDLLRPTLRKLPDNPLADPIPFPPAPISAGHDQRISLPHRSSRAALVTRYRLLPFTAANRISPLGVGTSLWPPVKIKS